MENQKNKLSSKLPKLQLKEKYINLNLKDELKNIINKDDQYTVPIFIPHRACKNDCVFCNQRRISGTINQPTATDVENIIRERLEEFKKNKTKKKIQIAFFGGSFTGLKIKEQIEYLEVSNRYIREGKVESIRLSTRPDYISVRVLKVLKKYGVKSIELGVQSMDEDVLTASKRGHTTLDVIRASKLIKLFGFSLGHQIMIGLPKSTAKKEISTIKKSLSLGIEELRIYPVYVINPTELYDMYISKKYIPLTLDEATKRTYMIIKECQKTDVRIIRIGLQSTDEITSSNKGIYGPVCDNFAEYALSRVVRDTMESEIAKLGLKGEKESVLFKVPEKYVSLVVGPKKVNRIYLENKYNIKMKVIGDN